MSRPRRAVLPCLTVALGAVSCVGTDSEEAGSGTEAWRVLPTPVVEIGVFEGADPYMFEHVRYARLLGDGRVVVADGGQLVIRVYGQEGAFETELGGPGEGPGQFQSIDGMWLVSDERIGIWDWANRRISTFSVDGELLSTHGVIVGEELPGNLNVFLGAFESEDIVLASLFFGGEPGEQRAIPDRWLVRRLAPDGGLRRSLGELRGMRRLRGQPLPFTPLAFVAIYRDSLYVVDGYEAEITVRDENGGVARTIELPPIAVSSGDAWSFLEAELQRRNRQIFLQHLAEMPRSDEFPQIAGLIIDDGGFLWTKVYDPVVDALWLKRWALRPGPGGEWRIVKPDGELVTTVQIPEHVTPMDIRDDQLVGVSQDALDVERIVVYRLER